MSTSASTATPTPPPSEQTAAKRDQLILELSPLVRTIACRLRAHLPDHVELEDLVQDGMLGLIDAVDRYDPARGGRLQAYAEFRIRGAMVDGLRQADWVPRAVRRNHRRLEHTRQELRQALAREPGEAEVAEALGLEQRDYEVLCRRARLRTLVSIETPADDEGRLRVGDRLAWEGESSEERWVKAETSQGLRRAMSALPEAQRRTLSLYYHQGLSLRRVGDRLGVTESRASQLRRAAVDHLRTQLRDVA